MSFTISKNLKNAKNYFIEAKIYKLRESVIPTVAILRGGLGGHAPPPVFFLISRLRSFGWHTQGCQMRSVKIPSILSTAPDLSCVVICKQHRENRDNQYCWATINNLPYFGWFVTFRCVCVTWQSHQGLRQQQQINFAEETVLTRFTTRVIMIWEILR